MSPIPRDPKVYHITHVRNVAGILAAEGIWSDAEIRARGGPESPVGMMSIKQRRLRSPVPCHPGDNVGDYVPFYFCPRSVMLYLLYRGNHPELTYREGQGPVVHFEAELRQVVEWAENAGGRWAFTLSNAGAYYAEFRNRLEDLDEVNWEAVVATDFRDPLIKEGKQAEFLVHKFFPWHLVSRIGVASDSVRREIDVLLENVTHCPTIQVVPRWYY